MADLKAFAEQLVNLTVKEVNELATILKEEYISFLECIRNHSRDLNIGHRLFYGYWVYHP